MLRGASELKVRDYNQIHPFTPRKSLFNSLSLSPLFQGVLSCPGAGRGAPPRWKCARRQPWRPTAGPSSLTSCSSPQALIVFVWSPFPLWVAGSGQRGVRRSQLPGQSSGAPQREPAAGSADGGGGGPAGTSEARDQSAWKSLGAHRPLTPDAAAWLRGKENSPCPPTPSPMLTATLLLGNRIA